MKIKRPITVEQVEQAYITKGALVLRRCLFILKNSADAHDMLQETFRRILKYKVQLETDDISLAFLYRTAERCCYDLLRSKKKMPVLDLSASDDAIPRVETSDGYEMSELLNQYFHSLDSRLQTVALMHYVDGLTQEQIAAELGWSRKTVGKKLIALRKSAQKLKRQ